MSSQETNVDRLLKARAEIDEELRRLKIPLTILFTDLVGSTSYFDRYGDTAGLAIVHRHAEQVSAVVGEFGGRVIKTIGDSVMAEFAEPAPAVRAAAEFQRRLLVENQKLPPRDRVQVRIGINHGPAFRHGGDVYGDAVNLAARVTKHAGAAQVVISHSVCEAILNVPDLRCTALGKVTIEGKAEKEDIFEVIWTETEAYDRLRATVTAVMTPQPEAQHPAVPAGSATPGVAPTAGPAPLTARYEILGELGRGGMGIVYKARDRITGDLVGLKVLKPEIASDQTVMERFKNEVRLSRKITHKNVCRVHEINFAEDTAYISMEFVEGESLCAALSRQPRMPLAQGLRVIQQICAGLQEAHTQAVVHRDLKPENVMLDRVGNVKIMDFGIARAVGTGTTLTAAIIGTPAYMSPEQAEGRPLDHRSDIYSLGVMLYEMLVGQLPFSGDTPVAIALKQVRERPTPPREFNASLPARLESAILKCLEKEPAHRFQSASELEAALTREDVPVARPVAAPTVPAAPPRQIAETLPAARPGVSEAVPIAGSRTKPVLIWALVAIALLVVGGVVTSRMFRSQPEVPPPQQTSQPVPAPVAPAPAPAPAKEPVKPAKSQAAPQPAPAKLTDRKMDELRKLFTEAGRAGREKRFDDAIAAFESILVLDPKNEMAAAGLERARRAKAMPAEQARPHTPGEALRRAEQLMQSGDYDAAIKVYEAILAHQPNNMRARAGLTKAQRAKARRGSGS